MRLLEEEVLYMVVYSSYFYKFWENIKDIKVRRVLSAYYYNALEFLYYEIS
jgi:hypothetical protein